MDTPPLPAANPYAASLPPPVPNKDVDHLKTLAICHYVVAGLSLLGLGFVALHYTMMRFVFTNVEKFEKTAPASAKAEEAAQHLAQAPFNPADIMSIFVWVYVLIGIIIVVGGTLTFLSGRFMHQRKNRTFSMIIAGLNCLHFPGIVLGVFSLVVLTRESVARLYAEAEASRNAAGN